ncbi:MAG: RNA-binding domain-containing protein [Candidatus Methanomethylophilaceae archaeon]|jgi:RNA binding exosome subunit
MTETFHWVRVRVFCLATEDKEKISEALGGLVGTEWTEDICEGEFGNITVIMDCEIKKKKLIDGMFSRIEKKSIERMLDEAEERLDDDCTFYMRLDKQKAVLGTYETGSGGDVISIVCKVASYPSRKELALENLRNYFAGILRDAP